MNAERDDCRSRGGNLGSDIIKEILQRWER